MFYCFLCGAGRCEGVLCDQCASNGQMYWEDPTIETYSDDD